MLSSTKTRVNIASLKFKLSCILDTGLNLHNSVSGECLALFSTSDVAVGPNLTLEQTGRVLNQFLFVGDQVFFHATLIDASADVQVGSFYSFVFPLLRFILLSGTTFWVASLILRQMDS